MNKVDMEVYHQKGGTYVVPTEIMNALLDENEALNKGIDELINKYQEIIDEKIDTFDYDLYSQLRCYQTIYEEALQDLKSLKGE